MNKYSREMKKRCPICGGIMFVDTSRQLTSLPPQYQTICTNCNVIKYFFCSEIDEVAKKRGDFSDELE